MYTQCIVCNVVVPMVLTKGGGYYLPHKSHRWRWIADRKVFKCPNGELQCAEDTPAPTQDDVVGDMSDGNIPF